MDWNKPLSKLVIPQLAYENTNPRRIKQAYKPPNKK